MLDPGLNGHTQSCTQKSLVSSSINMHQKVTNRGMTSQKNTDHGVTMITMFKGNGDFYNCCGKEWTHNIKKYKWCLT